MGSKVLRNFEIKTNSQKRGERKLAPHNGFFMCPLHLGWTAGKWHEWYPDVLNEAQTGLTTARNKYLWQSGWWIQHQRILSILSTQNNRSSIYLASAANYG